MVKIPKNAKVFLNRKRFDWLRFVVYVSFVSMFTSFVVITSMIFSFILAVALNLVLTSLLVFSDISKYRFISVEKIPIEKIDIRQMLKEFKKKRK